VQFQGFKATNARDKLYALLGLSDQNKKPAIVADYPCEEDDLYFQFAVDHIHETRTLDILGCTTVYKAGDKAQLPSWVPDWSHSSAAYSLTHAAKFGQWTQQYCCFGQPKALFRAR
jgi:hypothetical protein